MNESTNFIIRYKGYNSKVIKRQILFFVLLIILITAGFLWYDSKSLNLRSFGWGIIATSFYLSIHQGIMYYRGYAEVNGNFIKRRSFFSKSIDLSKIDSIRKFAGDYKFISDGQTIGVINYEACEESDMKHLDKIINKNKIKWI